MNRIVFVETVEEKDRLVDNGDIRRKEMKGERR